MTGNLTQRLGKRHGLSQRKAEPQADPTEGKSAKSLTNVAYNFPCFILVCFIYVLLSFFFLVIEIFNTPYIYLIHLFYNFLFSHHYILQLYFFFSCVLFKIKTYSDQVL